MFIFLLIAAFVANATSITVTGTRQITDLCQTNSDCFNHGICTVMPNILGTETRTCQCSPGYSGHRCEFNACPYNPCHNDGICEFINTHENVYQCHCPLGYAGFHCETKIKNTACDSNPCVNGICRLDGSLDNAVCDCFYYFTGPRCDQPTPCDWSTCSGHGTCSPINGTPHCTCESGWTGDRCEIDIDECAMPMQHCDSGICENTPGSFLCHCPLDRIGTLCEVQHVGGCIGNPCQNNGICRPGFTANSRRSFQCDCAPGFMGDLCEARINECAAVEDAITGNWYTPCDNGGACINGIGEHTCRCMPGHTGPACDDSVNECELFGAGVCQNGGTCLDNYNGFECACVIGFTGDRCEASVDDCKNNLCHPESTCIDGLRRYDCKCPSHRMGIHCQFLNPCTVDTPCQHGDCFPLTHLGTYKCKCQSGYTGLNCTEDIDECAVDSHLCYRGTCVNLAGSFRCDCDLGFEGKYCEKRTDECNPQPCLNGGTCIDGTADFECICMPAWTGKLCDEPRPYSPACSYHYCFHGGVCQRSPLGIESCVCPPRFEGDKCEMLRPDPCSVNICQNNGICVPTNDMKSFTCSCTPGFAGAFCQQRAASCDAQPCVHGTCLTTSDDTLFKCSCDNGFFGSRCERQQTQCDSTESSCGSGLCLDTSQGATCVCPSTHVGAACEIPVTNPCQLSPCLNDGVCLQTDIRGNFQCTCPSGFSGHICQFGSKKCSTASCLHGGVCDAYGGCSCAPGYGGQHCERELNRCAREFCQNGGTCENVDETGFACHCAYGFAGTHCELKFNVDKFNDTARNESSICLANGCSLLAANGICDAVCNLPGCDFDGGDCSSNISRPLAVCPYEKYCKYVLNNGVCDELCDNEACLFDGFDCTVRNSATCADADYCESHYADGICDAMCNIAGCGWDGGDCSHHTDQKHVLDEAMRLVLITDATYFIEHIASQFLMIVSHSLHAAVRFRLDANGHPMIYHWSEQSGQGELLQLPEAVFFNESRPKRQASNIRSGVVVYMSLDVSVCHIAEPLLTEFGIKAIGVGPSPLLSSKACFTNASAASNLLAIESHRGIFDGLNVQILNAEAVKAQNTVPASDINKVLNAIGCFVFAALFVIFAILVALRGGSKRRLKNFKNTSFLPSVNGSLNQTETFSIYSNTDYNGAAAKIHRPVQASNPCFSNIQGEAALKPTQLSDSKCCGSHNSCIHSIIENSSTPDNLVITEIEKLMANGIDVTTQNTDGKNPLHLAIHGCRVEVARYLLSIMNVNAVDNNGNTALHYAVSSKQMAIVDAILALNGVDVNALAETNITPLIKCAMRGDEMAPFVEKLLSYPGIEINKIGDKMSDDFTGRTALHEAAATNSVAIMRLLLKKGANISVLDVHSQTPLYYAVNHHQVEAARLLLNRMPEVAITTSADDLTPLALAQSLGHTDLVELINAKITPEFNFNTYYPNPQPAPRLPTVVCGPLQSIENIGTNCDTVNRKRNASGQARQNMTNVPYQNTANYPSVSPDSAYLSSSPCSTQLNNSNDLSVNSSANCSTDGNQYVMPPIVKPQMMMNMMPQQPSMPYNYGMQNYQQNLQNYTYDMTQQQMFWQMYQANGYYPGQQYYNC